MQFGRPGGRVLSVGRTLSGEMKRLVVVALLVAACGGAPGSPSIAPGATSGSVTPDGSASSSSGTAVASAAPEVEGEFAAVSMKGKGDKAVPFEIPEDAIGLAVLSHPGRGRFEVRALDEEGKVTQILVKTTGKYKGVVLFDLVEHSVAFEVSAVGSWKITVKPTDTATAWDGTSTLKGKGDAVVRLTTPSEADAKVAIAYSGKRRFAVRAHTFDDEIWLVDQTGKYKAQNSLPEETVLLEIKATGSWSVKPSA